MFACMFACLFACFFLFVWGLFGGLVVWSLRGALWSLLGRHAGRPQEWIRETRKRQSGLKGSLQAPRETQEGPKIAQDCPKSYGDRDRPGGMREAINELAGTYINNTNGLISV